MKMKKYISVLCAALILAAFTGCKSNERVQTSADTSDAPVSQAVTSASETSQTAAAATTSAASFTTTSAASSVSEETSSAATSETTASATTAAETTTTTAVSSSATAASTTVSDADARPEPSNEDVLLEITENGSLTEKTGYLTLKISYIGNDSRFYAPEGSPDDEYYITGANYNLEKFVDGKWKRVEFSDEMCWEDLAAEISGRSSPTFTVSLLDDDYAESITAGKYRIVKTISGVDFYAEFDIGEEDDVYIDEEGSITLRINKIEKNRFVCELPWPYYAQYFVMCDTSEYPDLCAGDVINVDYSVMKPLDGDEVYEVTVKSISPSSFELEPDVDYKPVIYLYPESPTNVSVKLDYNGILTLTDPDYGDGWDVTAYPDGRIISDGKAYPYLFWEGKRNYDINEDSGFCVSGEDTEKFLREKLAYLGLNEKETNDFLEFWLPFMQSNKYNVITFAAAQYTENAKLIISPEPDTLIRVYMVFGASDEYVDIPEQQLEKAPARTGFTVVEWGGQACACMQFRG